MPILSLIPGSDSIMAEIAGVFGAQSLVVLLVAIIGLVPIALYYEKTPRLFLVPYVFLFIAAFATNFENLLLPELLNLTEHVLGNMAAGVSFAVAAYLYRKRSIVAEGGAEAAPEVQ